MLKFAKAGADKSQLKSSYDENGRADGVESGCSLLGSWAPLRGSLALHRWHPMSSSSRRHPSSLVGSATLLDRPLEMPDSIGVKQKGRRLTERFMLNANVSSS